MTGQTLLDIMEDLNAELQLQTGEGDVTKGLRALNAAQDMLETIMAQHPQVRGGTVGTVSTAASTESTAFPAGLLRLDGLWYVDAATSRPAWKIKPIQETGAHSGQAYWFTSAASLSTGKPQAYWTNGNYFYWDPLPDAIYTIRWYGFQGLADITASGTFGYPDVCAYPVATMASRIVKVSLDDAPVDLIGLAKELFGPLVDALTNFKRDGAQEFTYTERHET